MRLWNKYIFRTILVLAVVSVLIFFWWEVLAQSNDPLGWLFEGWVFTDSGGIDVWWIKNADAVLKTLYLIMWPLLALAWAGLDNSLVYGQAFYLDVTLFKFWQLLRTFTMFGIGFVFVWTILYAFFNPSTAQQNIKDVVIKSLIAAVVVNMSRWIVAALIDISTILVAAVGGLPLQIMWDTKVVQDIRFLETHSYYDKVDTEESDANEEAYTIVYSCPAAGTPVFFIDCDFAPTQWSQWLIPLESSTENSVSHQQNITNTLARRWDQAAKIWMSSINQEFCAFQWALIKYQPEARVNECEERFPLKRDWMKEMKSPADWGTYNCHSFDEITRLAANSSWPLFTLYGSIFTLSNLPATTNYGNIWEVAIEMLMKIVVWAGLVIPLLAFAVVMIIRVVVLRLVIAFSPLLAMAYVYDFKKITEIGDGKFTFQNILNLLMMPVLWTFALCISIVFLSLINNVDYIQSEVWENKTQEWGKCYMDAPTAVLPNSIEKVDAPEWIPDDNTVCYRFLWIQTVCLNEWERIAIGNVTNTFTRLFTNLLWIALMRMAVMAVLKTNKFTEWAVDFIDSTAKSIAKSVRVIPVPWVGWMSIWWANQAMTQLGRIPGRMQQISYEKWGAKAFADRMVADAEWVDERVAEDASRRAETWDTTWMKKPGESWSQNFWFRKRESKWIPSTMATAIANEMAPNGTLDEANYPNVDLADVNKLRDGTITSFEELFANPAFVAHARKNTYYDNFTKNRSWENPQEQLRGSRSFVTWLTEQGAIVRQNTDQSRDAAWYRDEWYLHNGLATKVRRNPDTWMIDFNADDGGVKSYPFPDVSGDGEFANDGELQQVLEVIRKEFNNDIGAYAATFSDGDRSNAPYGDILARIPAVATSDQEQDEVEFEIGWNTYYVNVETATNEQWRHVSSIGVVRNTPWWTPADANPTDPTTTPAPTPPAPPVPPNQQ